MSSSVEKTDATQTKQRLEQALFEIRRVIAGQDQMLERVLVCLLTGGHLLIEGVPGLAKTLTVKTTADVLGGTFERIQFTPDLVPSDLIGTRIYRADNATFDTELGPVFCNFLLADEINRAPAKVQSALLEVMQERQVTLGHTTHPVPDPFLVMATQNPIESEGTYPLPEAQVDRFMLKILVDYPQHDEELTVIQRSLVAPPSLAQSAHDRGPARPAGGRPRHLRRSGPRQLRAAARHRDAPPRRVRAARSGALHLVRRQSARSDQPDPRGARARGRARPRLRARPGSAGAHQGRAPAPAGALVRGAGGAPQRRQHPRRDRRRRRGAAARPLRARPRRVIEGLLRRGQTPARPGPRPHAGAAAACARSDDLAPGRRAAAGRPPLGHARARQRARADPARTSRSRTTSARSTGT